MNCSDNLLQDIVTLSINISFRISGVLNQNTLLAVVNIVMILQSCQCVLCNKEHQQADWLQPAGCLT